MSADVVIRAEGLSKRYIIGHQVRRSRYVALRDVIAHRVGSAIRTASDMLRGRALIAGDATEEFWALKDVNFTINRGEMVGIVGRNGAGKSTLLKVLSRITEPTEGRVEIRGKVSSLLEVGTGFHPELSGRENIYLNGAILGMPRAEIRRKFDDIVAFAETEKFLDTPVKRYSSGMYVRLAFAVAAHLDPEILVVDEVLSVGDASFQRRCLGKIGEICSGGRTVLFVSHNMQSVRQLCSKAIWLDGGQIRAIGRTDEIVDQYLLSGRRNDTLAALNDEIARAPADPVFRLQEVDIVQDGVSGTEFVSRKSIQIKFRYDVLQDVDGLHVYFLLCDSDGTLIFESLHNGDASDHMPTVQKGSYVSTATIQADFLAGRNYELQVQAAIHNVRRIFSESPSVEIHIQNTGRVNRAYAGYQTPGKLAPLIEWRTETL